MQIQKAKPGYKLVKSLFGKYEEIPVEWTVITISNFGEIVTGNTPDTKIEEYFGNEYLWASPTDLGDRKYIDNTEKMLSSKGFRISRKIPPKSVLFVCIGSTIGKVGLSLQQMTTNQQINSIICKNNDPEFVYYQLLTNNSKIKNIANQVAIPILNKTDFGTVKMIKPNNIHEQRKIASILANVDSLIESYDSIIESTKRFKQGLIQKILTKGIGHKKFKKIKWHHGKEIEIPEEWEVKPLEKVLAIIQYGLSKPLSAVGKYPIFRMNSIQKGEVLEMDMKFIDLEYDEFKKYKLEKNDLLFNRTNSYELVGKIGIFLLDGDYTFAGYLIRLRTNEKMNPVFLNNYLNTNQSQYRVKRFATPGVSQTNINATNLKSVIIPVPPREEQNKIALILDKFDFRIIELKSKNTVLDKLKKALMQKLLTGQIRV